MKEAKNAFGFQGEAEGSIVVYPLLLNYGLSAVNVDSFNCPVKYETGLGFHLP